MTTPNWNWRPLGDLFDIGAGKTMSAAARAGADKVPFLRTSNVLWDEIDLTQVDEMSISPTELVDKRLTAGDLLVCEGGEIGRAAVWDGRVALMSFQNHLHRLRRIRDDVDARFYVYFLQSAFTQLGIFEGAGNKTTIPNLSRNRLGALDVPHPPMAEQQSIARALAKVREAVTVHDKATSTALELKHAVMSDLFTRGLRRGAQKETEIGLMPEHWTLLDFREVRERFTFEGGPAGPEALIRRAARASHIARAPIETTGLHDLESAISRARRVIFFCFEARRFPGQAAALKALSRGAARKTAAVLIRSSYDLALCPKDMTVIDTAGYRLASLEAALGRILEK